MKLVFVTAASYILHLSLPLLISYLYIKWNFQIGKTKVFLRAGQMAELDALRSKVLGRSAIKIQRKVRSYLARKSFIVLKRSAIQMQAVCRGNIYWLMYYFWLCNES